MQHEKLGRESTLVRRYNKRASPLLIRELANSAYSDMLAFALSECETRDRYHYYLKHYPRTLKTDIQNGLYYLDGKLSVYASEHVLFCHWHIDAWYTTNELAAMGLTPSGIYTEGESNKKIGICPTFRHAVNRAKKW